MRKRFSAACCAFVALLGLFFSLPVTVFGFGVPEEIWDGEELVRVVNTELRELGQREMNRDELIVILANQFHALEVGGKLQPGAEAFLGDLIDQSGFETPVEVHVTHGAGWGAKVPSAVFSKKLPAFTTVEVAVLNLSKEEAKKRGRKLQWQNLLVATAVDSLESGLPRYLHNKQTDLFSELEFLPNGRLLHYEFSSEDYFAAASDDPKRERHEVYPFLEVAALNWFNKESSIYFGAGKPERRVGYGADHAIFISEHSFEEVPRLEFFDAFEKYCHDPAPGQKPAPAAKPGEEAAGTPYHLLRHEMGYRFIEYDFRPDGKLFAYYGEETVPPKFELVWFDSSSVRFKVELLRWHVVDRETVMVKHGDKEELLKKRDYGVIESPIGTWEKVEELEFLPRLKAFCRKYRGDGE